MKTHQTSGGGLSLGRNVFRPMFGTPRFFLDTSGDGGGSAGGGAGPTGTQGQGNTQTGGSTQTGADFTPEQQAKIQDLINQAFGKGASKAEKEQATRIQQLEAELANLKGGKSGDKTAGDQGAKSGYDQDEIKKLLDGVRGEYEPKLTEANQTIEKLKSGQRNAAVMAAAAVAKAVDPVVVAKLVGDAIGFDGDGRLVVLDASGQPRLNAKAEPMSVDEYVASFLEERPYLKQPSNAGGAGSGTKGAGGSQTFTRKQIEDPDFYRANKDAINRAVTDGRIVD